MEKRLIFSLFLSLLISSSMQGNGQVSDLELLILKNPAKELRKGIKRGNLEKVVHIIKLVEQKRLDGKIFQESDLTKLASEKEIENKRYSIKWVSLFSILCAGCIGTILVPAGASKYLSCSQNSLDTDSFIPMLLKASALWVDISLLAMMCNIKRQSIKNAQLINQLVHKYNDLSLAN